MSFVVATYLYELQWVWISSYLSLIFDLKILCTVMIMLQTLTKVFKFVNAIAIWDPLFFYHENGNEHKTKNEVFQWIGSSKK